MEKGCNEEGWGSCKPHKNKGLVWVRIQEETASLLKKGAEESLIKGLWIGAWAGFRKPTTGEAPGLVSVEGENLPSIGAEG